MKSLAAAAFLPLLLVSCKRESPSPETSGAPRTEVNKGSDQPGGASAAVPGSEKAEDFAIGEEEPAPEPVAPPAN